MKISIKARFSNAILFEGEFESTKKCMEDAVRKGAYLEGANLKGAYLEGAYLEGAYLEGAYLEGAYLEGAYLEGAYLEGAYLEGANLKGAYLEGAYLEGAYLKGAYLEGANLEGAYLEGAYLEGAYLEGAYLEGAYLKGAYLEGAYLEGAYLEGANLEGAYLEGAIFTTPKEDFFELLSHAEPEIPLLRETIVAGKINGSIYEGECACLCGTIEKSGRFDGACDMRNSSRPVERFALGIRPGRTPDNDDRCKLLIEWIDEYQKKNPSKSEAA